MSSPPSETMPGAGSGVQSEGDGHRTPGFRQRALALLEVGLVCTIAVNTGTAEAALTALLLLVLHRRAVLRQALRPLTEWRARLRLILVATAALWALAIVSLPLLDRAGLPRPDISAFASRVEGDPAALLFMLVRVWTVVAFGEEILGRVFLVDRFEVLFANLPACVPLAVGAAAVLFGLAHAYQGRGGILMTAAAGLVLGFLYVRQQRQVWVNVIVHGAVDTVAMLLLFWGVHFF